MGLCGTFHAGSSRCVDAIWVSDDSAIIFANGNTLKERFPAAKIIDSAVPGRPVAALQERKTEIIEESAQE
jgi:hypothetical protein